METIHDFINLTKNVKDRALMSERWTADTGNACEQYLSSIEASIKKTSNNLSFESIPLTAALSKETKQLIEKFLTWLKSLN